jgi:two-component system sensor histidine kinase UhpB
LALQNARLFEALRTGRERLQALSRRLAEVEEAERQRLARELHDQVGQNLTALGINLNIVRTHMPENVSQEAAVLFHSRIEDCLTLVDETTERVRGVMADLRPPLLDDYGLVAALRWYRERFTGRTGISVGIEAQDFEPRLPAYVENELFRIVQEALTNVAKHAQVHQAKVAVEVSEKHVCVTIADEGAGFEPEILNAGEAGQRGTLGLISMAERAETLGAKFHIESQPRRGTKIRVEISR